MEIIKLESLWLEENEQETHTLVAECLAMRQAIIVVMQKKIQRIIIESDSQ